ncbi:MAG: GntR family transcriptional regulator [Roseiflexaceae bacterium]
MTPSRRFQPGFDDLPHLPKYLRLATWLEQQIANGIYTADQALPTEEALCREFGLSRGTVQQAIQNLVQKGLVRREQGRGSFVNPPRQADVTSFTLLPFNELIQRQGRVPSTRVRLAHAIPASAEVAERLKIPPATPVFQIERLRLADGQPIALEERFLATTLSPDLLSQNLESDSIHRLLVESYQLPLVRMEHVVELIPATAAIAVALDIPAGQAIFAVDRLTYTLQHGQRIPAVWFRSYSHDGSLPLTPVRGRR